MKRLDLRNLHEKGRNVYLRFKTGILVTIILVSMLIAVLFYNSLNVTVGSSGEFRDFVDGFGLFAPVMVVVLIVIELIFFPLPASVIATFVGYVYGVWVGSVYSYIGYMIVAVVAFIVSRRLGRPFIERIINPDKLERYDLFFRRKGRHTLWLVYIFPFFPNVVLSFVIGLSTMRFRDFIKYPLIGYIPNLLLLSYLGSTLFNYGLDIRLLLLLGVLVVLLVVLYGVLHKKPEKKQ